MKDSIQTLRTAARQLARGKVPRAIRYPADFRAAAITCARTQLRRGHAVECVADAMGVTTATLARWLGPPPAPALRPVVVIGAPPPATTLGSSVVLITPEGVRVEGLDREGLVAVLHALR